MSVMGYLWDALIKQVTANSMGSYVMIKCFLMVAQHVNAVARSHKLQASNLKLSRVL